jgi:hypothetical protein
VLHRLQQHKQPKQLLQFMLLNNKQLLLPLILLQLLHIKIKKKI